LFFVSVGMLFDPTSLFHEPLPILGTLLIIVVGKAAVAFLIVLVFGYPLGTALTISASLAQIGEFSFILAELGVGLNLLPREGRDLILAGAILSILLNPVAFAAADWLRPRVESRVGRRTPSDTPPARTKPAVETPVSTKLTGHTILVGYGRVGTRVGKALKEAGVPFLVIDDADKVAANLHDGPVEIISGNATKLEIITAANAAAAYRIIVAIPNAFEAGQIVLQAKAANPAITIIARAHSDAEVDHLTRLGAQKVIMGESEIARGMIEQVFEGSAGQNT
jgi:CPA2 family monovalent cation:H+ antiporter-2